MARFFFIWSIMIGAMVGIREGTHFVVDLWPPLNARGQAVIRLIASVFVLVFACVFLVGHRLHALRVEPHLRTRRAAALVHPFTVATRRRDLDPVPR